MHSKPAGGVKDPSQVCLHLSWSKNERYVQEWKEKRGAQLVELEVAGGESIPNMIHFAEDK